MTITGPYPYVLIPEYFQFLFCRNSYMIHFFSWLNFRVPESSDKTFAMYYNQSSAVYNYYHNSIRRHQKNTRRVLHHPTDNPFHSFYYRNQKIKLKGKKNKVQRVIQSHLDVSRPALRFTSSALFIRWDAGRGMLFVGTLFGCWTDV